MNAYMLELEGRNRALNIQRAGLRLSPRQVFIGLPCHREN